ncbi:MAG: glycosyltransferase [Kineosporiaceae bacterium]
MRVLLLTNGSRGDVQPFLALAHGLAAAGAEVRLAAPARTATLADAAGVPFHPLDDTLLDLQDLAAGGGVRAALTSARQAMPLLRRMLDTAAQLRREEPPQVVVHHPKALAGPHLAEAWGVPAVAATLLPLYRPTREFALPVLPGAGRWPRPLARASWRIVPLIDAPYARMIRTWRAEMLDLPARSGAGIMTGPDGRPGPAALHAWSASLLPAPADWPPEAAPLGAWLSATPQDWAPPDGLAEFLAAGTPPVSIGFGSMVGRDPERLTAMVRDAVRAAGARAVLTTGWGGLRETPGRAGEDLFIVEAVPHGWLFPRVAAVVQHGGAGTVAAAARAGRPQLIRPFLGDQPFWADRVHRLGLGPAPLRGRLDVNRFAGALRAVLTDPGYLRRAGAVAESMAAEDGVGTAVQRILALGVPG